jgi:hypothetical protein
MVRLLGGSFAKEQVITGNQQDITHQTIQHEKVQAPAALN